MTKHFALLLGLCVMTLVTACSSPSGGNVPSLNKGTGAATAPTPFGGPVLVGIGDSLTAGEQSDATLGIPTTYAGSAYASHAVPPGQSNGWFADMYDCVTSTSGACNHTPYNVTDPTLLPVNAAAAVLPLINAPGINTQLVLNASTLLTTTQSACSTFNMSAFGATTWQGTRENPPIGIADLGIPGITMHEAVYMNGPYSGPPVVNPSPAAPGTTCGYATLPNDPTSGGLQSLVQSENQLFLPVLGGYAAAYGSNLTELNVAVGMKPKLATVWLGANDILKYLFSGGNSPATDTPAQMEADLTKIVKSLTAAGTKVLVADLPTILPASGAAHPVPEFFPQANLINVFEKLFMAPANAQAIVSYLGTQYGITSGGYLTDSGLLTILAGCAPFGTTCNTAPQLDIPGEPGSGLGTYYLTPAFAAQVQQLNAAYIQVIDSVATSSGSNVALVPINTVFQTFSTSGVSVGGQTLTLQYGGGLVSWDGLHPSNAGYALIANEFITVADQSFGMTIPQLNASQLAAIATGDPYNPTVANDALFDGFIQIFPLP